MFHYIFQNSNRTHLKIFCVCVCMGYAFPHFLYLNWNWLQFLCVPRLPLLHCVYIRNISAIEICMQIIIFLKVWILKDFTPCWLVRSNSFFIKKCGVNFLKTLIFNNVTRRPSNFMDVFLSSLAALRGVSFLQCGADIIRLSNSVVFNFSWSNCCIS